MKMIQIVTSLVVTMFATGVLATDAPPALDYNIINKQIAAVLAPLFAGDPTISDVQLVIDPKGTDVTANHVQLSLSTTVKDSSWSAQPTTMAVTLEGSAQENSAKNTVDLTVKPSLVVKTSVVPMFQFLAGQILKEEGCKATPVNDFQSAVTVALCHQVEVGSKMTTLTEFFNVAVAMKTDVLAAIDTYQPKLKAVVADTTVDPMTRATAARTLDEAIQLRANVAAIDIVAENADGAVTKFSVKLAQVVLGPLSSSMDIRDIALVVTPQDTELSLSFTSKDFDATSFSEMKTTGVQELLALQMADPNALDQVKQLFQSYYIPFVKYYTHQQ